MLHFGDRKKWIALAMGIAYFFGAGKVSMAKIKPEESTGEGVQNMTTGEKIGWSAVGVIFSLVGAELSLDTVFRNTKFPSIGKAFGWVKAGRSQESLKKEFNENLKKFNRDLKNLKGEFDTKKVGNKLEDLIAQIENRQEFNENFDKDLKNNELGLCKLCDICFDDKGDFECYNSDDGSKVELSELEKSIVKEISDLIFKELDIRPARVSRITYNFWFHLCVDGEIKEGAIGFHHSAFASPKKISVTI